MKEKVLSKWEQELDNVVLLHNKIKNLDESLLKLYTIAIVKDNVFYIFDYSKSNNKYQFVLKHNISNMEIPNEINACFPLDFYNNKIAAVISESSLKGVKENVVIFHEFVHCYQNENGEQLIKENLLVNDKNNFMWELDHPFPYGADWFIQKVKKLIKGYDEKNINIINQFYAFMKSHLKQEDFEYMIWQEWKEGYARFVENKINKHLGFDINNNGINEKFNRVTFYHLGSKHIDFITNEVNKPYANIKDLYKLMYEDENNISKTS